MILQGLVEIWRFWRTPRDLRKIVFYAEHEGYFSYFEGIIHELTKARGVPIAYITSDARDPILKTRNSHIKAFYIKTLLPYFMIFVKARAFVMTMPDLNQFHIRRSIHPVHYVYVFHALVSTHMIYREGAFDHYDTIFCVGPHHIEEIRARERQKGLPAKKLVEAGYWRLERIHQKWLVRAPSAKKEEQKMVLIAPSWGDHNILKECGVQLIGVLSRAGYDIVVRPHPEILRHTPEVISTLEDSFGKENNVRFEKSVSSDESILKADVLITDTSGIALEYAFGTERPVLFIDVPPKVKNENFRKLGIEPLELVLRPIIGVILSPRDLGSIENVMTRLLAEKDSYKEKIKELRSKYVYAFGKSSEIGAKYIAELTNKKSA